MHWDRKVDPRLSPPMENMMIWDRKGESPYVSTYIENMMRWVKKGDPPFVSAYGKHDTFE